MPAMAALKTLYQYLKEPPSMSDAGRADALLADLPRDGRGRLKVFLGAAPGVGKTYAMLQAAHTQLRQGVRLIVSGLMAQPLDIARRTGLLERLQAQSPQDVQPDVARAIAAAVAEPAGYQI